jgi:hypothetical protein
MKSEPVYRWLREAMSNAIVRTRSLRALSSLVVSLLSSAFSEQGREKQAGEDTVRTASRSTRGMKSWMC